MKRKYSEKMGRYFLRCKKLPYSLSLYPLPFPVLSVLSWASLLAMLTPLSCCLSCLIFVSSSVLLFCFSIHVSLVLCCLCPHLVFVFVLKYPLKMEVNPFGRCADICTDADRWVHTSTHACKVKGWFSGCLLYLCWTHKDQRGFVRVQEWMCDGVCVCAHTYSRGTSVFCVSVFLTSCWQWRRVPLKGS